MADVVAFETGAVRGAEVNATPYHMLSAIALRRYANAMAEGTAKYGAWNWKKGFPAGSLIDHIYAHIGSFLSGDTSEDHLGHALWNLATLVEQTETHPELFRELQPECVAALCRTGLTEEHKPTFIDRRTDDVD